MTDAEITPEPRQEVGVLPLEWRAAHSRLRFGTGLLPGMEYVLDGEQVGVPWRLKFGDRVFGEHVGDFTNLGAAEAAAQDHYAAIIRSALSPFNP